MASLIAVHNARRANEVVVREPFTTSPRGNRVVTLDTPHDDIQAYMREREIRALMNNRTGVCG